jgi:hypothetical protein
MSNPTWQKQYYTNMSKAFASLCEVFATVMDASVGPGAETAGYVNQGGLWFKAEFPILQELNKVLMIEAISPDGNVAFTYWTQPSITRNSIDQQDLLGRDTDTGDERWLDLFSVADNAFREEWRMGLVDNESLDGV